MTAVPAHNCSILIVEDEAELQELLRVALESDGYEVAVVNNGREALQHLRSTPTTCLIILDLFLPVLSGHRFRAVQLRDRSLAWIPVVVVSGGVDAAREARELGARAFVKKPVDVDQLRAAIRGVGCLRARQRPDQRDLGRPGTGRRV
jgi:CheY-like chemotaxis protein